MTKSNLRPIDYQNGKMAQQLVCYAIQQWQAS